MLKNLASQPKCSHMALPTIPVQFPSLCILVRVHHNGSSDTFEGHVEVSQLEGREYEHISFLKIHYCSCFQQHQFCILKFPKGDDHTYNIISTVPMSLSGNQQIDNTTRKGMSRRPAVERENIT